MTAEPTQAQSGESPKDKFFRLINEYLENELRERSALAPTSLTALKAVEGYDDLDEESKKAVDKLIEQIRPDIEKKAADLLLSETRDKIARTGNIKKLVKAMEKGKKLELKRKKGCIFLQIGTGEPGDELDEFLIAST